MKRLFVALALAAFAVSGAFAADSVEATALTRAKLAPEVKAKALDIFRVAAEKNATIQADIRVKDAELARLLVGDTVDQAAVRAILESTAKLEVDQKMVRIQAELQLRDLVGKDKWILIRQWIRKHNGDKNPAPAAPAPRKPAKKQK